jgi:hypothetical protein
MRLVFGNVSRRAAAIPPLFTLYILRPFTAPRMVAVAGDLRGVQGTSKRSLKATASTV